MGPMPPVGEALSETEPVTAAVGVALAEPVPAELPLSLLPPVADAELERELLAVWVEGKPSSSSSQVSSVGVADLVADGLVVPDAEVMALVTEAAVAEPAPDPEAAADWELLAVLVEEKSSPSSSQVSSVSVADLVVDLIAEAL